MLFVNVTFDLLMSLASEEEIFSMYGLHPTTRMICNPYRNDSNPTCSFYRGRNGRLYFKDFSGFCHWDCVSFVMFLESCSYPAALKKIYDDLIKGKGKHVSKYIEQIKVKERADIKISARPYEMKDVKYWQDYHITLDTLELYRVKCCNWVKVNDEFSYVYNGSNLAFAYDLQGEYKIYFPTRSKYRFLSNTTKVQGFEQLVGGGTLVLQKSMKDVLLMRELGIDSIALQAETNLLDRALYDYLSSEYDRIVSFYDYDEAGITYSSKLNEEYGIEPIWFTPDMPNYAKDCTDFVKKNGIEELIATPQLQNILHV